MWYVIWYGPVHPCAQFPVLSCYCFRVINLNHLVTGHGRMDEKALLNNNIDSYFRWFPNVHAVPYELYPEESACVQVKAVQGLIIYIESYLTCRPIGKRSSASRIPSAVLHLLYRAFWHGRPFNNAAPPPAKRPWLAFRTTFFNVVTPLSRATAGRRWSMSLCTESGPSVTLLSELMADVSSAIVNDTLYSLGSCNG